MLKELKAETGRLAQGQVDISANVATAQKSFEEGFVAMNTRILKIEAQCDKIDDVKERLILAEEAVKTFEQTSTVMSSRLDVIEDRARRDNLIFHGIPDAKESWIQTEEKIVSLLMQHVDPNITDDVIERAHRLGGSYQENRCRPVIVKFSRFKLRQQVLFKRATFKDCKALPEEQGNADDARPLHSFSRFPIPGVGARRSVYTQLEKAVSAVAGRDQMRKQQQSNALHEQSSIVSSRKTTTRGREKIYGRTQLHSTQFIARRNDVDYMSETRTAVTMSKREVLALLVVFIVYVVIGGAVFMAVEGPREEELRSEIAQLRLEFHADEKRLT
ncbi:hypothetical protein HPB51_007120 [Rhipicephalus microplus]|uniref:Uncharacterized protein n=1 Tax=Rhipicephalus microplus TaxID=6941 RepID=A0A9J6E022_RHIMP|nr:hypothetical protein HPB51_007120 [Rhipicephalus microplus]